MKILVLCYEYPPLGGGGGRVAAQVARELAGRGHDVTVQTSGLPHLPPHEKIDGVEIVRTACLRQREDTCSVPEMAFYLVASFFPAWRLARKGKPDVIHAHFAVPTGALAFAVSRLTGIPYVLTAHLGDVPGGVPEQTAHLFRLVNPLARILWTSAAAVTAVSSFVAGLARAAYGIDPVIIRNGVKPRLSANASRTHSVPRILLAGRLSVQKNPLLALQALALLKDLDWSLDIIGEGPLGPALRAEATKLNLENRVTFHGWLAGERVAAIMAPSDILLMTSLHEGLPMVGVEALHHGLAVVGSAIGGMQDIVEEGKNGLLCALNPEAFAGGLRRILSDPALLSSLQQASRSLAPRFDLAESVDAYEKVLLDAAAKAA